MLHTLTKTQLGLAVKWHLHGCWANHFQRLPPMCSAGRSGQQWLSCRLMLVHTCRLGTRSALACHDAQPPSLPYCRSGLHSFSMSLQALHLKPLHLSQPLLV